MNNWSDYIDKALSRLSPKKKPSALPQLSLKVPESTDAIVPYEESPTRREQHIKRSLSYQLFEKMRRRTLSWKSYYYYDEYDIPRLAITNHNATGTHIIERRDLIPEDQIIEANLYTNENASKLLIDGNDLENVHQNLFNQLSEGSVSFQVYNKTHPLEIWFDNDQEHISRFYSLGKHKICVNAERAYLLRPFRNLGAEGFSALTNRLLAQEGIPTNPKNVIESLLIELGNEELLRHYQSALSHYNQHTSVRRSSALRAENAPPLIITKTRQQRAYNSDQPATPDSVQVEAISDDAYERLALVFDKYFEEMEENLLEISLEALSLNQAAVMDSCTLLKDKLRFYAESALLQDYQLNTFYQFMQQFATEPETEEVAYSPLEDQAYQEILFEVLEAIRDITTDPRYDYYPPIQIQIDAFQENIESLTYAYEDAQDKQRRREIHDKREILTAKAFESPNPQTYTQDKSNGEPSYYDHLLEVQKGVNNIQNQLNYAVYDVALGLAESTYILTELHLKQFPDLHEISDELMELMEAKPQNNYGDFERQFVETLVYLTTSIHNVISTNSSDSLMKTVSRLADISGINGQYTEDAWDTDYIDFVRGDISNLNKRVRETALKEYNRIAEQLNDQLQLIETFISGISVPALLPSQLNESGTGLQTFLVQQLQQYLSIENLQLHTVPGRENQLRALVNELMPTRLETPLEQLEYFFITNA